MVIKIHKAAQVHASLNYLVSKMGIEDNKIIAYNNITPQGPSERDIIDALKNEFSKLDRANIRTDNISFHASINPTEEELKRIDIQELCKEYMVRLGYAAQPYIVVEHNDTGRRHYHIISHRVQPNGKKINDYNERRKTNNYVKELNQVMRRSQLQHENIIPLYFTPGRRRKDMIAQIVTDTAGRYRYDNIFELQKILLDRNIELIERDGHFIAAGIDRGRRIRAVKVEFEFRQQVNTYMGRRTRERMCNIIKFALEHSMSELHARRILAKYQLGVQFLKNDDGRIYGVYYIDHKNCRIVKGSVLSQDVSAALWNGKQGEWQRVRYVPYQESVQTYQCLSWEMANVFLYNRWSNDNNLSRRDLYYSSKRENNRRIL